MPDETPIGDLSRLKIRAISTRAQLNQAEAENVRKAVAKYLGIKPNLRTAPFDYDWLLKLHKQMFGDVWEWAGIVRTTQLNIGIEPHRIGQELGGLCLDIAAWEHRDDLLLEQSVTIHDRAVRIHPFENGNGRWARLLANIWAKRQGGKIVCWPDAELGRPNSSIRNEYIAAIKAADEYDCEPLSALHLRFTEP